MECRTGNAVPSSVLAPFVAMPGALVASLFFALQLVSQAWNPPVPKDEAEIAMHLLLVASRYY